LTVVRLQLLDTLVEIETDRADTEALLARLWQPFLTSTETDPHASFRVVHDGGRIGLAEGDLHIPHDDFWAMADALRYRILEVVEARLVGYVTLHAAAVARDGRLLLLAGESGAGKTTLTLALLRDGWTYLSDDVAPIDVSTGEVVPFPKPLGVKEAPAEEPVTGAPGGAPPPCPGRGFLVPPGGFAVGDEPLAPDVLVFPRFRPGEPLVVEELTPGMATALATPYVRRVDPDVIRILNRLCRRAASYVLSYGETRAGAAAVARLIVTGAPRRDT
jgi:hypothetical protein